jgi:nitroimidazol reductase NimA-like FMN-containing flavoprotein (pyridoxamine 5'-phosphate oxidase superfamily)
LLIHELTPDECRAALSRVRLARLACSRHDQPYIVPVYVHLDGNHLYSFSTVGQKIDWMRSNPMVCVEVDDVRDPSHWTTVVALGWYEELTDSPEHRVARDRARELLERHRDFWLPAAGKPTSGEHPVPVLFRIRIDRLTGRRAGNGR